MVIVCRRGRRDSLRKTSVWTTEVKMDRGRGALADKGHRGSWMFKPNASKPSALPETSKQLLEYLAAFEAGQ